MSRLAERGRAAIMGRAKGLFVACVSAAAMRALRTNSAARSQSRRQSPPPRAAVRAASKASAGNPTTAVLSVNRRSRRAHRCYRSGILRRSSCGWFWPWFRCAPARTLTGTHHQREIPVVSRCAPQAFVASASLHAFSRRPATTPSPRPVPKPLDGLGAVADPPAFRWGTSAVFERPAQTVLSACARILVLSPGELVL